MFKNSHWLQNLIPICVGKEDAANNFARGLHNLEGTHSIAFLPTMKNVLSQLATQFARSKTICATEWQHSLHTVGNVHFQAGTDSCDHSLQLVTAFSRKLCKLLNFKGL